MRPHLPQFLLVMPVQFLLVLVIGLPAVYILWLSLTETSYGVESRVVGHANNAIVLSDPYLWRALHNTCFLHQSLDYRPEWVDDARATRLQFTLDDQTKSSPDRAGGIPKSGERWITRTF